MLEGTLDLHTASPKQYTSSRSIALSPKILPVLHSQCISISESKLAPQSYKHARSSPLREQSSEWDNSALSTVSEQSSRHMVLAAAKSIL
jgi:hypothetical protein